MVEEVSTSDSDPLLDNRVESQVRSSEIVDEEIDASSAPCCRICLESDGEPEEELISPCMCKGTQQFVHRSCLDHWRSVKEGFAFTHCTTCKAQFHLPVQLLEDNSWRKIKFRIFVARDVLLVFWLYKPLLLNWVGWHALWTKMGTSEIHLMTVGTASYQNIPYLFIRVLIFFVLLGFFGLMLHCSSFNNSDPYMTGCRNCCYGWGILDCFPAFMEACFAPVIVFVVIFAILGIAYGFLATPMAIQRIWQRHYHITTKKELTKEYIVEGSSWMLYTPKVGSRTRATTKTAKAFIEALIMDVYSHVVVIEAHKVQTLSLVKTVYFYTQICCLHGV